MHLIHAAPSGRRAMTDRVLDVDNLSVKFGDTTVVDGASFYLDAGEIVALVGESGSGKSVSALSVLQLLPYPQASHPNGSILLHGEEMLGASKADLQAIRGGEVGMIFQEPMTSLNPLHTVGKQIGETLRVHKGLTRGESRNKALDLLERVQLPDPNGKLDAYPHQLSGGQRQRVMIAMALANSPKLLIADEPTTALDVTIQASILDLLKELNRDMGMAILMISHDLGIVRRMARRVYVMNDGKVVETGPTEQLFTTPKHTYTNHLLNSRPSGRPAPLPAVTREIISAQDMKVGYNIGKGWLGKSEQFIAVQPMDFSVAAGETLAVVGESGSGKTSLGLATLKLIPSSGRICYLGTNIQDLKPAALKNLRRNMQMVFQDPYGSLSPRLTVRDIVAEGLSVHERHLTPAEVDARVVEALQEVGLQASWMSRYPHEFSGGQRQRISLARAQVLRPDFIVLDEPTSALDMSVQSQIVELLRELQRKHQLAYLFISHDLAVVRALAHRVIVMKEGVVVEQGDARQIFEQPQTAYTQALLDAAVLPED
jgi:microcin C transport system ATP-binding protein